MKLRLVKASQGLVWVRQGVLALKQQPLGYLGLLGLLGMVAILLLALPARLGAIVVVGLMPMGWMAFMLATRRVMTGQKVSPGVVAELFRAPKATRKDLLLLGAAYIVATLAVLQIGGLLGPDAEEIEKITSATGDMAVVLGNPLVQQDMLIRMLLTLPISLMFWHTPALILWGNVPVPKALFFSAVACWRNLGAFVIYGLGWGGLMLALGLLDRALASVIPAPALIDGLAMIAGMALASAFYASLYFTVVDCFEPKEAAGTADAAPDLS
jgi:hypothetical protein